MLRLVVFVAALSLARGAFGFQFQSVANMGPELSARFGMDYTALGALVGAYMLPGIVAALPEGMLGRRFGERPVVGAGLALMAVGSVVAAGWFTPGSFTGDSFTAGGIWAGRMIAGTGAVALIVLQGKMVSDRVQGAAFMTVMGFLVGAFPIGVGLVGLSHDAAEAAFGPAGLFVVGAVPAVLALVLFWPAAGRDVAPRAAWAWPSRGECARVVVAGLTWTAYNAGYYGFLSYMPSLMAVRGDTGASTVLAVATWTNLPAAVAGGVLAGRFGNTPVMVVASVSGAVSLVGAAAVDAPLVWACLFGLLGSLHAGVIVGVGTLSARPENRAVGMGMFYTTYYIGGAVFPAICGAAADWSGSPAGAMVAAAGLTLFTVPAYLAQRRMARGVA